MTGNKKFPLAKVLILVAILALPGFLYYLLQAKGENRYKPLPVFGPKTLTGTSHSRRGKQIPDTAFHHVQFPVVYNPNGQPLDLNKEKQELLVLSFFAMDEDVSAKMSAGVKNLATQFADNKRLHFVSINLNPADSAKMTSYAKEIGATPNKWDLVTADTAQTFPFARKQLFVNALQTKDGTLIFSDKLVLLDADHQIRGYYTATSEDEIRRITDEIKVLITEELRKIKAEP
ncbi:SCO family protein [Pelobium manganitolerans]|uniref:SCO family protein n=1 Tax=Pelobium manganitolerans TaxID=1842495 RepID=UPI003FA380CD